MPRPPSEGGQSSAPHEQRNQQRNRPRARTERRRRHASARGAARSCGGPHHRRRHHAGDVSVRARADHCRAGAAGHRQEPGRHRRSVLGGHRVSACHHGGDAIVRKTVGHLRPARHSDDRDRHFYRRLGRLRAGADLLGACPGAWPAGDRRRRPVADRADHYRRPTVAARTAGDPGPHLDHVHERQHSRAGAWRVLDRPFSLVADFLDQRSAWRHCADHDRARAARPAAQRTPAPARHDRRCFDGRRRVVADAGAELGRHALSRGAPGTSSRCSEARPRSGHCSRCGFSRRASRSFRWRCCAAG